MLAIELIHNDAQLIDVGVPVLRHRILRILRNQHLTHRCITHKAQNIRFHEPVINDWIFYTNQQIVVGKYAADCIVNVDEMNIDFDPSPRTTVCRIGERTVNGLINGHSGRCTVMLGCTMSGIKLPAFVIWKGVPNGRIDRETHGPRYPHNNIKYSMQV